MRSRPCFCLLTGIVWCFFSCNKDAQPLTENYFGVYSVRGITAENLVLQVLVNNHLLTDALQTRANFGMGGLSQSVQFSGNDTTSRWQIKNSAGGTILLDTTIRLSIRGNTFSVVQLQPGAAPFISPSAEETAPVPGGWKKIRVVFRPDDRDSFKTGYTCYVLGKTEAGSDNYAYIDTLPVQRYGVTPYYLVKKADAAIRLRMVSPQAPAGVFLNLDNDISAACETFAVKQIGDNNNILFSADRLYNVQ